MAHHRPETLSSRGGGLQDPLSLEAHGALQVKSPPFPWNTCHSSHLVGRETEAKHRAGSRKVGGSAGTVTVPSQPPEPGPLGDTVRERGKSCGMGEGPWLCAGIPRRRGERGCLAARMHERGAGARAGCAGPHPESCPAPEGQAGPREPTSASSSHRCQPVWNVKRPGYARRPRGLCGLRGWEAGGTHTPWLCVLLGAAGSHVCEGASSETSKQGSTVMPSPSYNSAGSRVPGCVTARKPLSSSKAASPSAGWTLGWTGCLKSPPTQTP